MVRVSRRTIWLSDNRTSGLSTLWLVWLISPPTSPTVISSPYRSEMYQRSFIWALTIIQIKFKSSLYADKFTRLFWLLIQLVLAANYGRWCRLCRRVGGDFSQTYTVTHNPAELWTALHTHNTVPEQPEQYLPIPPKQIYSLWKILKCTVRPAVNIFWHFHTLWVYG